VLRIGRPRGLAVRLLIWLIAAGLVLAVAQALEFQPRTWARIHGRPKMPARPMVPGLILGQPFVCPRGHLDHLGLVFATYGQRASGHLEVALLRGEQPPRDRAEIEKRLIRKWRVEAGQISDNGAWRFDLPARPDSLRESFYLILERVGGQAETPLTVWLDNSRLFALPKGQALKPGPDGTFRAGPLVGHLTLSLGGRNARSLLEAAWRHDLGRGLIIALLAAGLALALLARSGAQASLSPVKAAVFWTILVVFCSGFGLLVVEAGLRWRGGYYLNHLRLLKPNVEEAGARGFYALNQVRIYNARFVAANRAEFRDWPSPPQTFNWSPTEHPFYVLRPGFSGPVARSIFTARRSEDWRLSTTSLGFRGGFEGAEIALAKPAGALRIACLGASTTFGSHGDKETYPYYLSRDLKQALPGRKIEVVNAGHDGYKCDDLVALLRQRLLPLKPDLVTWYQVANDHGPGVAWIRPNPLVEAEWQGDERISGGLNRYSALWRRLQERLVPENESLLEGHEFLADPRNRFLKHWEGCVRTAVALCRRQGVTPVLCTFATVMGPDLKLNRETHFYIGHWLHHIWYPLTPAQVRAVYDLYNDRLRALSRELKVPLVEVARAVPAETRYFWDGVHLYPHGNELISRAISRFVLTWLARKD